MLVIIKGKRQIKSSQLVKGQLRLLNCKKDKLGHKHLIHINKFVRKDSNALNNLKLEMVEWELNGVFCEGGVIKCVFLRYLSHLSKFVNVY